MKADPALSACKHSWPVLSYVTHEAAKAVMFFSTCILIFKLGFLERLLYLHSISSVGIDPCDEDS